MIKNVLLNLFFSSGISWLILPLDFAFPIDFLGIEYRPWRLLIVAFAMPFAIGTVLLSFAPESPKFLNATGQPEKALEVVKLIYAANQHTSRDNFEVSIKDIQQIENKKKKISKSYKNEVFYFSDIFLAHQLSAQCNHFPLLVRSMVS